jgi:membrane-bound lytic murein transglycosylase B
MTSRSRRHLFRAGAALALALCPRLPVAAETFAGWLEALRREARQQGIGAATLDRALRGLQPIARIIELDRRQPESRMSFAEYRRKVISTTRIERGRVLRHRHALELQRVADRYGVAPEVIVALWGIESSYGELKGKFPVIAALATLAWDGRRAGLFRRELISALRILDSGDVAPADMYGSWAGAMGQCQFMPSTYLRYAVDADGDGRRDIWSSLPDVFASIANYLRAAGWNGGARWGREVQLPRNDGLRTGLDHKAPLQAWASDGVRLADGAELPVAPLDASLVVMDGSGPSFLVYSNFRTLMVWNRSTYFALSVGLLSDMLREG